MLDKAIDEALADVVADHRRATAINGTLQRIRFAVDRNEVQDLKMLLPLIRAGERSLFEALFAKLTGISVATARRCLYETGGRALAVACRGCQIDKSLFTEFFIALRQLGEESGAKIDPGELFEALSFYDTVDQAMAEARVAAWRRGETHGALVEEIRVAEATPRPSATEAPTRKMYAAPDRRKTPFNRMN